jgi:hypothetical protein
LEQGDDMNESGRIEMLESVIQKRVPVFQLPVIGERVPMERANLAKPEMNTY